VKVNAIVYPNVLEFIFFSCAAGRRSHDHLGRSDHFTVFTIYFHFTVFAVLFRRFRDLHGLGNRIPHCLESLGFASLHCMVFFNFHSPWVYNPPLAG